jgi:hypothetical protein
VRGADAQHWSDGHLQRIALPTRTWMGLSALHSDLAFEGCMKHQGPDTRPRLQAGPVCVREENRRNRKTKFLLDARFRVGSEGW